jgi:hypothetical protein
MYNNRTTTRNNLMSNKNRVLYFNQSNKKPVLAFVPMKLRDSNISAIGKILGREYVFQENGPMGAGHYNKQFVSQLALVKNNNRKNNNNGPNVPMLPNKPFNNKNNNGPNVPMLPNKPFNNNGPNVPMLPNKPFNNNGPNVPMLPNKPFNNNGPNVPMLPNKPFNNGPNVPMLPNKPFNNNNNILNKRCAKLLAEKARIEEQLRALGCYSKNG